MRIGNYVLPVILMAIYGCSTSSDLSHIDWINDDASWVKLNAKLSNQWQMGPGKWERVGMRIFRNSNHVVGYAIKGDNKKFKLECQVFIVRSERGVAEFKALSAPSLIELDAESLSARPVIETVGHGVEAKIMVSSNINGNSRLSVRYVLEGEECAEVIFEGREDPCWCRDN